MLLLKYRVVHQLSDLVWVELDLGHFIILPGYSAISAKMSSALAESARRQNSQDQSQPNQGPGADGMEFPLA